MYPSDIWIKFFRMSINIRDFDFSCPTHAMMMLHAKAVWPSLVSVSRVAWNVNGAAAVTPRAKIEFAPWSARLGRYRSAGVCTILTISGRITFGVTRRYARRSTRARPPAIRNLESEWSATLEWNRWRGVLLLSEAMTGSRSRIDLRRRRLPCFSVKGNHLSYYEYIGALFTMKLK